MGPQAGVRQVIAGWDEALLTDLKVGGKRLVVIPSALGYGKRGAGTLSLPITTRILSPDFSHHHISTVAIVIADSLHSLFLFLIARQEA